MAFSQTSIVGVPSLASNGRELIVSWMSTSPAGTLFQVYYDGRLAWSGTSRSTRFPLPRERVRIDVGTVAANERAVDFSGSLPTGSPPNRVKLTWLGGKFLALDLAGFHIYGSTSPGGSVNYSTQLADIPATVAGNDLSGFGLGGYGLGGYGLAASSYAWTSGRLSSGVWTFAVVAYDQAGNENASPITVTATIVAAPNSPAPNPQGQRLTYTYNLGTGVPTLRWLASP